MKSISKTIKHSLLSILLMSSINVAFAQNTGIQAQLNRMFEGMIHSNELGVFENQRRTVISGGGAIAKTQVVQENIVSFVPPSFSGSCNGIDIFGGSFSFINAEKFKRLLRQIAMNAQGYAFQLALSNICEDCAKIIASLQSRIQALNEFAGNSCQLAQGIVNDVASAFKLKAGSEASFVAQGKNLISNVFSTNWESTSNKVAEQKLSENKTGEDLYSDGNIVWKKLTDLRVGDWFGDNSREWREAIMSVTGSVIVGDFVDDPSNSTQKSRKYTNLSSIIGVQSFMDGGVLKVWSCEGDVDDCNMKTGVAQSDVNIVGLTNLIKNLFIGSMRSKGIVQKIHDQEHLTNEQVQIFRALPQFVATAVNNLSIRSPDVAEIFVKESSSVIAREMAFDLVNGIFRSVELALRTSEGAHVEQFIKEMQKNKEKVEKEYDRLLKTNPSSVNDLIHKYQTIANFLGRLEEN